jgi:hypothetical protein
MTNKLCLAGIKCPKCGNSDRFQITASITADVTDAGADIHRHSHILWDEESDTSCPDCGEAGPLSHFQTEKAL